LLCRTFNRLPSEIEEQGVFEVTLLLEGIKKEKELRELQG